MCRVEEKYELNLSVNRLNPDGLRILSLRGCTAACIVNLVFGEVEGWEGGKGSVLDHGSAVEACCMLCVWVCGIFLGECYVVLHEPLYYVAWLQATLSLPAACQMSWMLADALRLPRTWLLGMPDTHKHSENTSTCTIPPPLYCRSCYLSCPTLMFGGISDGCRLDGIGTASGLNRPCLFRSIRRHFHWFYLVYTS